MHNTKELYKATENCLSFKVLFYRFYIFGNILKIIFNLEFVFIYFDKLSHGSNRCSLLLSYDTLFNQKCFVEHQVLKSMNRLFCRGEWRNKGGTTRALASGPLKILKLPIQRGEKNLNGALGGQYLYNTTDFCGLNFVALVQYGLLKILIINVIKLKYVYEIFNYNLSK